MTQRLAQQNSTVAGKSPVEEPKEERSVQAYQTQTRLHSGDTAQGGCSSCYAGLASGPEKAIPDQIHQYRRRHCQLGWLPQYRGHHQVKPESPTQSEEGPRKHLDHLSGTQEGPRRHCKQTLCEGNDHRHVNQTYGGLGDDALGDDRIRSARARALNLSAKSEARTSSGPEADRPGGEDDRDR